jgi:hypothetical protein
MAKRRYRDLFVISESGFGNIWNYFQKSEGLLVNMWTRG